jgi:hypothetical protein
MGVITIQRARKGIELQRKKSNLINIYVLPFKAMVIMASYCFFIHLNVKEFKQKSEGYGQTMVIPTLLIPSLTKNSYIVKI